MKVSKKVKGCFVLSFDIIVTLSLDISVSFYVITPFCHCAWSMAHKFPPDIRIKYFWLSVTPFYTTYCTSSCSFQTEFHQW